MFFLPGFHPIGSLAHSPTCGPSRCSKRVIMLTPTPCHHHCAQAEALGSLFRNILYPQVHTQLRLLYAEQQ